MPSHRLRVLLFGLDPALSGELKPLLADHDVVETLEVSTGGCAADISEKQPDVVICASERRRREMALLAVAISRPWIPVIVASRQPEEEDWLDALEAGAADYCSAPFDAQQIRWILDSSVPRRVAAVA